MNLLNKSRHSLYHLTLHIVWTSKHQDSLLPYQEELQNIIKEITTSKEWSLVTVLVLSNYMQVCVSVPPSIAPSEVVKTLKGQSARKLLIKHPELISESGHGSFWNPSYLISSKLLSLHEVEEYSKVLSLKGKE